MLTAGQAFQQAQSLNILNGLVEDNQTLRLNGLAVFTGIDDEGIAAGESTLGVGAFVTVTLIPGYLAWCDVAFLSFADNPLFERTIPAKLQSYMACAMPVLAVAGGETKRIVEEAQCGIACPMGDAESLAEAIVKLRESTEESRRTMAENALWYSRKHFAKEELLREMNGYMKKEQK